MSILFETDKLRIEHEFENAYLIEKPSDKELMFDNFYGDPTCGLISLNNDWAVIAGEHLTIWRAKKRKKVKRIEHNELRWIHDIKLKSENVINILTEPWNGKSAIWELEIDSLHFLKLRDFKNYSGTGYLEGLDW